MSSMFDTLVRDRRQHTPWARMNLLSFCKDVAWNEALSKSDDEDSGVTLSVRTRPDVASRYWYTISWVCVDGERREVSAQEYDLLLWRAAQMETSIREKMEKKDNG